MSFPARGQNGVFLAIMATCWWARAVESAEDLALFEQAVEDIHWVIKECIRAHSPSASDEHSAPSVRVLDPHLCTWRWEEGGKAFATRAGCTVELEWLLNIPRIDSLTHSSSKYSLP
jgi:hypothetical protein